MSPPVVEVYASLQGGFDVLPRPFQPSPKLALGGSMSLCGDCEWRVTLAATGTTGYGRPAWDMYRFEPKSLIFRLTVQPGIEVGVDAWRFGLGVSAGSVGNPAVNELFFWFMPSMDLWATREVWRSGAWSARACVELDVWSGAWVGVRLGAGIGG